jgi:putative hydrolase of the HAD superfamily
MKITTILFDFVGVLLKPDHSVAVSQQVELVDRRIGEVIDDSMFRDSILQTFCLSNVQFESILEQVVDRYKPFEPLWQMLPCLRGMYRLGVINNGTWLTYPRYNAKYRIDQQFDVFVSSAVEGVRKPDPQIYLRACEKLRVSPDQCIFLDDSKANVSGAINAGMQGMWWKTHQTGFRKFRSWLAAHGGAKERV